MIRDRKQGHSVSSGKTQTEDLVEDRVSHDTGGQGGSDYGNENSVVRNEGVSWAWWLLPIFLQWLGGLIAWGLLKGGNSHKSKVLLVWGFVMTCILDIVAAAVVVYSMMGS